MCIWINIYVYVHKHKISIVSFLHWAPCCVNRIFQNTQDFSWLHVSLLLWLVDCVSKLKVTVLSSKSLNILLFILGPHPSEMKTCGMSQASHFILFRVNISGPSSIFPTMSLSAHNPGITRVALCVESAPRITLSQCCAACPCRLMIASLIICGSPSTVILQGCQKLDF